NLERLGPVEQPDHAAVTCIKQSYDRYHRAPAYAGMKINSELTAHSAGRPFGVHSGFIHLDCGWRHCVSVVEFPLGVAVRNPGLGSGFGAVLLRPRCEGARSPATWMHRDANSPSQEEGMWQCRWVRRRDTTA